MPRGDSPNAQFIGQRDFGGGMNALDPDANQYRDGINVVIRDRYPRTRPATRRSWTSETAGVIPGFFFNEEGAKYNDATHTGFWFDFDFIRSAWDLGGIQGLEVIRFSEETQETIIFVSQGIVFLHRRGWADIVSTEVSLANDEVITFTMYNDRVIMWRGEELEPMYWDGTDAGFLLVGSADTGDDIPYCSEGLFHVDGRLWAYRDRDDVYASDVLDFNDWDYVYQLFSIRRGDGDELMKL